MGLLVSVEIGITKISKRKRKPAEVLEKSSRENILPTKNKNRITKITEIKLNSNRNNCKYSNCEDVLSFANIQFPMLNQNKNEILNISKF